MKCNLFPFFFKVIRCGGGGGGGGDFGSGSGSKLNCAARVGSDDLGYGPGSGFSFEPVQTSNASLTSPNPRRASDGVEYSMQTLDSGAVETCSVERSVTV